MACPLFGDRKCRKFFDSIPLHNIRQNFHAHEVSRIILARSAGLILPVFQVGRFERL